MSPVFSILHLIINLKTEQSIDRDHLHNTSRSRENFIAVSELRNDKFDMSCLKIMKNAQKYLTVKVGQLRAAIKMP